MIVNDPVFGFIEVPKGLLTELVKHPYFVRLTRLKQLGPTFYVYPGAMHTRFQHSIGTLHLVSEALDSLENKGVYLLEREREGTQAAMLLHDIGHGPMSHALENAFVRDIEHEEISLLLMERINKDLDGQLDTAISIYRNLYPKKFLHELVCSQLDMDRMDYLCRDSLFTGVREGTIGAARIIKMLDVKEDRLVVGEKGVYTIENYLMSRRLMYWQVYFHKTAMAAQEILLMAIRRAQELAQQEKKIPCSPALGYFIEQQVDREFTRKHPEWIDYFVCLDDSDLISAMKQWIYEEDKVLSLLARDFVERHLFKAKEIEQPVTQEKLQELRRRMAQKLGISEEEARYFVRNKEIDQMLYSSTDDHICIEMKNGKVKDISEFSELLHTQLVDKKTRRYYLFYQRCGDHFSPFE